ncbi:alsin-like isoform X2 [Symsagittifera roscoffensis]|uniref:alsin-like isoform X2 n=1 Tax=Symsagittifera roscoffensis TaxID=84072 RepID=UPI00307B86BB
MPEDKQFILVASSASDKADWCLDLTKAIERALHPGSVPNIACEAQLNETVSMCMPSREREAVHTFSAAHAKFKGATYKGTWLNAKPHDKGMLVWPDGKTYIGDFHEGLQHGQGRLIVHSPPQGSEANASSSSSSAPLFEQSYVGQWANGFMHGFGVLNYHNGDQYVGEFEKSMRCGFGLLRIASPTDGTHHGKRSNAMRLNALNVSSSSQRQSYHSSTKSSPMTEMIPPNVFPPSHSQRPLSTNNLNKTTSTKDTTSINDTASINESIFYVRSQYSSTFSLLDHQNESVSYDRQNSIFSQQSLYPEECSLTQSDVFENRRLSTLTEPNGSTSTSAVEATGHGRITSVADVQLEESFKLSLLSESMEKSEQLQNFMPKKREFPRLFYGEWIDDKRHGYGVLEDDSAQERHVGLWLNDLRHGNGLTVCAQKGLYYEGTFQHGKLTGTGLLLADDDSMYEGELNGYNLSGKGILTFPHGDYLEGSFDGSWSGSELKIKGVLKKLEAGFESKPCGSLYRKFDVSPSLKWECLFRKCRSRMGILRSMQDTATPTPAHRGAVRLPCSDVWSSVTNYMEIDTDIFKDIEHIVPLAQSSWYSLSDEEKSQIRDFLTRICGNKKHPIGQLMDELEVVFRATYEASSAVHRRLLPHSISELKSITTRLTDTIGYLLPCIDPKYSKQNSQMSRNSDDSDNQSETFALELVHPLVFGRVYSVVISLYVLSNADQDANYRNKLEILNKKSDKALMSFYEVEPKFQPSFDANKNSGVDYSGAIEALKKISDAVVPSRKLECVSDAFEQLVKSASQLSGEESTRLMMDTVLPIFLFVIVRAKVRYLSSEIQFVEDFANFSDTPEAEFILQTVKVAYVHLTTEKIWDS